jgi:hypothetical protein
MEFTYQGAVYGFTWLDLATGKLPIAGIGFAGWAAGEKECPVVADYYGHRDLCTLYGCSLVHD